MSNETFEVVDADGVWIQSKASFPLIDPNSQYRFVPGRTVKIKPTAWISMQVEARAFTMADDPSDELEMLKSSAKVADDPPATKGTKAKA